MGNKLGTYILIMSGIMLLMYFGGVLETNGTTTLLNILLNPNEMPTLPISTKVLFAMEAIGGTAIAVALVLAGKPELALMSPVAIYLFDLGWGFLDVYNKIVSVNPNYYPIATLLFAPLFLLFVVTVLEWWRGVTTWTKVIILILEMHMSMS